MAITIAIKVLFRGEKWELEPAWKHEGTEHRSPGSYWRIIFSGQDVPTLNFDKKHFEKFCYVKIALLAHSPTCISTHAPCGTSQTGREKAVMVGWVLTEMDAEMDGALVQCTWRWQRIPEQNFYQFNMVIFNLTEKIKTPSPCRKIFKQELHFNLILSMFNTFLNQGHLGNCVA